MRLSMRTRKVVAGVLALTLVASMCVVPVVATSNDGAVGTNTGTGVDSGTSSVFLDKDIFIYNSEIANTGYRMYLCPAEVYNNRRNALNTDSVKFLNKYKRYAFYEFSGGAYSYSNEVNKGTTTVEGFYTAEGDVIETFDIPEEVILSAGAGANVEPSFSELVGDGKGFFKPWSYLTTPNNKLDSCAEWANKLFDETFTEKDLAEFFDNYKERLKSLYGELGYESAGLPANLDEYYAKKWSIIIEPVMLLKKNDNSNKSYAISYQDYRTPYIKEEKNRFYKLTSRTMGSVSAENAIPLNISVMSNFYAEFERNDGVEILGSGDTSGFGVFAQFNNASFNINKYDANVNIALYNEADLGYSSATDTLSLLDVSTVQGSLISKADEAKPLGVSASTKAEDLAKEYAGGNYSSKTILSDDVTDVTDLKEQTGTTLQQATGLTPDLIDTEKYNINTATLFNVGFGANDTFDLSSIYNVIDTEGVHITANENLVTVESGIGLGNTYTYKLVGNGGDASSLTEVAKNGWNLGDTGTVNLKGLVEWNVPKGSNTENIASNLVSVGLADSDFNKVDKTNATITGTNASSTHGLTMQFLTKKQNANSYIQTFNRDASGEVLNGSVETLTYDITSSDTATITPKSGNSQTYVISIPNASQTNIDRGYTIDSTDGGSTFVNMLLSEIPNMNSYDAIDEIKTVLKKNKVDFSSVQAVTSSTDITLGSVGGSSGKIDGYSVYVITDERQIEMQQTRMTLHSKDLNYIYPTLLGETPGHLLTVHDDYLDGTTITKSTGDKAYGGNLISAEDKLANANILHSSYTLPIITWMRKIFGDFSQMAEFTTFDKEDENPKTFSVAEDGEDTRIRLSHAVNLTRGAFDDSFVVSSMYKGNEIGTLSSYYTDSLGLELGIKSNLGKTGGVDKQLSTVGFDTFAWDLSNPKGVHCMTGEAGTVGYEVSQYANRYYPQALGTGVNKNAGLVNSTPAESGKLNYKTTAISNTGVELFYYPEVKMSMVKPAGTDGLLGDTVPKSYDVRVMGDAKRSTKQSTITGLAVVETRGNKSSSTSTTTATGTDAKALSKRLGNLPVVYAGGNINLSSTDVGFGLKFSGFTLDVIDKNKTLVSGAYTNIVANGADIYTAWGNNDTNSTKSFEDTLDDVIDGLDLEVSMRVYDGNNLKNTYDGYNASYKFSRPYVTSPVQYPLTFKNGGVVADANYNALMNKIKEVYGLSSFNEAVKLFNGSGMINSVLESIESSNDIGNKSDNRWYDEEVRTLVVNYYDVDPVTVTSLMVSDKVDIGSAPDTDPEDDELFDKGYVAEWYVDCICDSDTISDDIVVGHHLEGADFIIPNATTSDMRR